jgi:hypothetical protein
MATIYVSSTYADLRECRERVVLALGRLNHHVVNMEKYVARDDRPLDACLQDVAGCDVYVGLFAHRYGYIPDDPRNPEKLSITELELRTAQAAGKPCLIFLQDPAAPWPPLSSDSHNREGENGGRIAGLREALEARYMRVLFRGAEDIGELVATSVTNTLGQAVEPAALPDPRQISTTCFVLHSPADAPAAQGLADVLQRQNLSVTLSPRALFSATAADLEELDADARAHQVAILLVTPNTIGQCATRAVEVRRVMSMLEVRTGCLLAVTHPSVVDLPADWPVSAAVTLDPSAPTPDAVGRLVGELEARCPTLRERFVVGLQYLVVAMTRGEAEALRAAPEDVGALLSAVSLKRFEELRTALDAGPEPWPARYGDRRPDWRPFRTAHTLRDVLDGVVERLNSARTGAGAQRKIKLQYYPIDPVVARDPLLRSIYLSMARAGCVAIVDELSLLNPAVRPQVQSLLNQPQVSVITISPVSAANAFDELLETEARRQLGDPFNRWELDFDPQCEFGVDEEHHLRRWLHRSLPETMRQTEKGIPDRSRLERLRSKVGEAQGMGSILFPHRGGR